MRRRSARVVFLVSAICMAAAAAGIEATNAADQVSAASGGRVAFSGCPVRLVEANCIGVESNGTLYDITGTKPAPKIGDFAIEGSGVKSSRMTYCMQGILLDDVTWSYTKEKCAAGAE